MGIIIILLLQVRKLWCREVKKLVEDLPLKSISAEFLINLSIQIFIPFLFLNVLPSRLLLLLLLSRFSRVRLCATPEMAAHQASPSLGFSRQEHWSGLPFPSPTHESEK